MDGSRNATERLQKGDRDHLLGSEKSSQEIFVLRDKSDGLITLPSVSLSLELTDVVRAKQNITYLTCPEHTAVFR